MLTQLFLAARREGSAPLPYAREAIRSGLAATAERLNTISPDLATQFLDVAFADANLADRFLLSSWGTLSARMRPLLTETVIRSLAGADFAPADLMTEGGPPVTIYLRWPERDLLALSPLIRLLWGTPKVLMARRQSRRDGEQHGGLALKPNEDAGCAALRPSPPGDDGLSLRP